MSEVASYPAHFHKMADAVWMMVWETDTVVSHSQNLDVQSYRQKLWCCAKAKRGSSSYCSEVFGLPMLKHSIIKAPQFPRQLSNSDNHFEEAV